MKILKLDDIYKINSSQFWYCIDALTIESKPEYNESQQIKLPLNKIQTLIYYQNQKHNFFPFSNINPIKNSIRRILNLNN